LQTINPNSGSYITLKMTFTMNSSFTVLAAGNGVWVVLNWNTVSGTQTVHTTDFMGVVGEQGLPWDASAVELDWGDATTSDTAYQNTASNNYANAGGGGNDGRRVRVSAGALETMRGYRFPGNIRELRNLIERLMIMVPGPTIDAEHVRAALPRDARDAAGPVRLGDAVRGFEREQIEAALVAEGGNMTRAAQRLGIERSHLYKKMKRLGCRTDAGPP
jgi:hypothetical protein